MSAEDFCGRCLTMPNASISFTARSKDGTELGYHGVGRVQEIAVWADRMGMQDPDVHFDYGSMPDVLIPVSTWNGDKVCQPHLWELTDHERRRGHGR